MEIPAAAPATSLTSQQTQPSLSQTAEAGATKTEQTAPDNVVTALTDPENLSAREDDALRRDPKAGGGGLSTIDNLRVSGFKTRIDYDNERERVFLEIIEPKTEEILQRIPSEGLLEYLSDKSVQPRASSVSSFDQTI